MHHEETEDLGALSASALTELETDHGLADPGALDGAGALFFSEEDAVGKKTQLGDRIVAIGMTLLNKPVREDVGTNQDKDSLIRTFFLEGIPWKASYWDDWMKNHPQSPVPKPEWCAAFACYCVRQGYHAAGLDGKLPSVLSASTSGLRDMFIKLGRFIARDDLFDADGKIKPGATLPGPGDIALWQGHTGLLYDIYADGNYRTLEGNTKDKHDAVPGVYLLGNSSSRKISKDGKMIFSLTGFCQLASLDGISSADSATPAT